MLFQFRSETSPDQIVALREGLLDLRGTIPEIRHLSFGPNLASGADEWPWVLVVHVDNMSALQRYADHPAHRKVVEVLLTPIRQGRLAVDVEMGDGVN
ncbi:MAG TPA: Dabb family protein [Gemmatimonadales bacterium]|nr:Dabb family protein [Gemmatimonadales bacterium]